MGKISGLRASISLETPKQAVFSTQAIVHKWVDADIYQYEASLRLKAGKAFSDFDPPVVIVIPRKSSAAKSKGHFTNLRQGEIYQVLVLAKGNAGGTLPSTLLNGSPGTAVFDFSAHQDVHDTLEATLGIMFDAVPFSGTGTTIVQAPADGKFQNPVEPEKGTPL